MSSSKIDADVPLGTQVHVGDDALRVTLTDGRVISVPLNWYPRLLHASSAERSNWRLIADGIGIHWPDIDEDISIEGLLAGRPSQESDASLKRWLADRPRTG